MKLVLLPGMDGTGDFFTPLKTALNNEFIFITVSYPCEIPLNYAHLQALVDSILPVGEPYVLLAESFSGPLAIALASGNRPDLKALILCCTFARNPAGFLSPFARFARTLPIRLVPIKLAMWLLLGKYGTCSLETQLKSVLAKVSPQVWQTRIKAVLNADVSSKLNTIKAPALYLQAGEDRVVPPRAADLIARQIPQLKITTISGPHFLLQARPLESAQVIKEFLVGLNQE